MMNFKRIAKTPRTDKDGSHNPVHLLRMGSDHISTRCGVYYYRGLRSAVYYDKHEVTCLSCLREMKFDFVPVEEHQGAEKH